MIKTEQINNQEINVLELRNYLLKPNKFDEFAAYFNTHFVTPMNDLKGYTLGQFKINKLEDRFVWFRGFHDMKTRLKFLNDFYVESKTWKDFGKEANNMMINSDNVYLLKPLAKNIASNFLNANDELTVVDFYICNQTLDKVIALFNNAYLPFLKTLDINNVSLWVSEMQENDFPRLPVFQDKNLLVSITTFKNKRDYKLKQKRIEEMSNDLKQSMQELITIQSTLLLFNKN